MFAIQLSPALFVQLQAHVLLPPFVLSVHFYRMVCDDHPIDCYNESHEHAE